MYMDAPHLKPPWNGEHEYFIDPEEPPARPSLSAEHEAMLVASGIAPEIWEQRCYQTVYEPRLLEQLGFSKTQSRRVPGLLVPLYNPSREDSWQFRPDNPALNRQGKPRKYESRWGYPLVLDIHPRFHEFLDDPSVPLIVTEGVKKVDALATLGHMAVGLIGVDCWRSGKPLDDWDGIELEGRRVILCFDSDARTNPNVLRAMRALERFLLSRGAYVECVLPPATADGSKQGIDDYLGAGGRFEDLFVGPLTIPDRVQVGDDQSDLIYQQLLDKMAQERAHRLLFIPTTDATLRDVLRSVPKDRCWNVGYSVADPSNGEVVHGRGPCNGLGCPICLENKLRDEIFKGHALWSAGRQLYRAVVRLPEWRGKGSAERRWRALREAWKGDYFYSRLTGDLLVPGPFDGGEPVADTAQAIFDAVVAAPASTKDPETGTSGRRFVHPKTVEGFRKAKRNREPDGKIRRRIPVRVPIQRVDQMVDEHFGPQQRQTNGNRTVTHLDPSLVPDYVEQIADPLNEEVIEAQEWYLQELRGRRLQKEYEQQLKVKDPELYERLKSTGFENDAGWLLAGAYGWDKDE
jgi:hypothetical protein